MIFTLFIALILLFQNFTVSVNAQECTGSVEERISCYTSNITNLNNSGKTLSSQISQFDTQIKLTTLKITQTEDKINQLSGRISQIEVSLDSLTNAFTERAVETYKMARSNDPFFLLISSSNLNEIFGKFIYLKKIQESDQNLLQRLHNAQNDYVDEKLDQEDLQNKLAIQKKNLDSQKLAKANLLKITQNDEKKYQALLSQALAEKAAIENALISGVKVGPVKAGDPIALVGNSGYPSCSTGKHLHFEVRKDNNWTDPTSYLQNKSIYDEATKLNTNIGSGNWPWPISGPIRLTQHYGITPYSSVYRYSGGIHTGFDMVSSFSDVIKAPADGNLFKSSGKCGSSTINIVYIEHGDGVITFYLHVQ